MKETIQEITGEIDTEAGRETGLIAFVVRAQPNDLSGPEYIRLHIVAGGSYLWNAPVEDWSEAVGMEDERWLEE